MRHKLRALHQFMDK